MNLWMLDHDPVKAASFMCDKHVRAMPFALAQLLAYAWHDLESEMAWPLDDPKPRPTPWLTRIVHPAWIASQHPGKPFVQRKALFPGESGDSEWRLFKQHVPAPIRYTYKPEEDWVTQTGGNYNWLWQHAAQTIVEHQRRFAVRHPAAPAIWTLEQMPWSLRASLADWSETPLGIPHHMRVADDGFYDTVASNRRWYNIMIAPGSWTGPAPEWHVQEHQLSIDS